MKGISSWVSVNGRDESGSVGSNQRATTKAPNKRARTLVKIDGAENEEAPPFLGSLLEVLFLLELSLPPDELDGLKGSGTPL